MKILKTITQCRSAVGAIKEEGLTIGLVPTMGYLHEGHLSLARTAKRQCHRVFMTIFVNPTQFGPGEDFNRYPRDLKRDAALAGENGVDYIFNPSVGGIYKKNHKTHVEIEDLTEMMCGGYRPGHFRGVATVVLKLFNIIPAQRAYFGKKDYQQLVIIKKMVRDLNLEIKIIGCPTVRERDGLALSSRNKYLKPGERENAAVIYRTLKNAEKAILGGEGDTKKIKKHAAEELEENPHIKKIDYFDIRDAQDLKELKKADRNREILIATAVRIGKTRLIDSVVISKKK